MVNKSCCIKGCNVASPDVEYYKFPVRGALLKAWVTATGASSGDVCSAHFTSEDYKSVRGKRRLLHTAVPSLLCKPPPSAQNGDSATNTPKKNNKKHVKTKVKAKRNKKPKEISIETLMDTDDKASKDAEETTTTDKAKDDTIENADRDSSQDVEMQYDAKKNADRESTQVSVNTTQTDGKEIEKNRNNHENAQPEVNDIEDMITNYQIKQTKTLADRLNPEPLEDLIPTVLARVNELAQHTSQAIPPEPRRLDMGQLASHLSSKLDDQLAQIRNSAPVFIEVAVEQGSTDVRADSPQDCVMLLESVQCDVDPSSLMLPEHGPDTDSDMEILDPEPQAPLQRETKKADPISLLTSSDEDEVILQEPHIDTVEVSDETDEDDRPLQSLVQRKEPIPKKTKWVYHIYQCVQCEFKTNFDLEFKQHNLEYGHVSATTIHVCPTCNYTTSSKAQFSRHKRKHKDERNFKCHLCNYKARHNMSLTYHLKSHAPEKKKSEKFTCDKCGFSSNVKSEALSHLKLKACNGNKYSCDECSYSSKRRSDLRRHRLRKHSIDDTDEEYEG